MISETGRLLLGERFPGDAVLPSCNHTHRALLLEGRAAPENVDSSKFCQCHCCPLPLSWLIAEAVRPAADEMDYETVLQSVDAVPADGLVSTRPAPCPKSRYALLPLCVSPHVQQNSLAAFLCRGASCLPMVAVSLFHLPYCVH